MIMIDEKRPENIHDPFYDPWANWKPEWTGKEKTPHDLQEKKAPTEKVTLRLSGERQKHQSQRRIVDARLWDAMTAGQQDAALQIAFSFERMSRGIGYAQSNWQRIPGARGNGNIAEAQARLINHYIDWTTHCAKRKISHAMILDILCFGHSCRTVDRDRRQKNGTSRQMLMEGLSLYCERRGWPV